VHLHLVRIHHLPHNLHIGPNIQSHHVWYQHKIT
jgi:hypothetical protein